MNAGHVYFVDGNQIKGKTFWQDSSPNVVSKRQEAKNAGVSEYILPIHSTPSPKMAHAIAEYEALTQKERIRNTQVEWA